MKEIQKRVRKFNTENKLAMPIEHRVLDTVSELGEVSKEILKMSNYGRKKLKPNNEIQSELGDVFYSLIGIANHFDIELAEALNDVLNKYTKRLEKGSAGSDDKNKT